MESAIATHVNANQNVIVADVKMKAEEIKQIIKEDYSNIAKSGCSCCSNSPKKISSEIGYSKEDIDKFSEANLGLGCGNPLALAQIKKGDTVLDLGSGAGFDAFLCAKKVGETGKVIGVDMTEKMIEKAKKNAEKYNYQNIEFKLGDIEELPLENESVDKIISNCVINLAPDKDKVFLEAFRVLKKQGELFVSDIVLLEELSDEKKTNRKLLSGCVAGALQKEDYLNKIKNAGFKVEILGENKEISKQQYNGIALESIKVKGVKNL